MEYVYASLVFLLSAMEAVLFYHVICRRKLAAVSWKRLLPLPVLYLALLFCMAFAEQSFWQTAVIMLLYYMTGIIFTQTGWVENIKYWILSLFLSSATELVLYLLVWGSYTGARQGYGMGNVLISAFVSVMLFIIYKLGGRKDIGEVSYSGKIFLFMIPAVCAITVGITYMAYTITESDSESEKKVTLGILLFTIVGVCIVVILILYILWQRDGFRIKADMEEERNRQQKAYFELLLEKEKETRRFRHDVMNHFICLQAHIQNQRYQAADTYLGDLLAEMEGIRNMQYETGNEDINILLNYYLVPARETCTVTLEGYLGSWGTFRGWTSAPSFPTSSKTRWRPQKPAA